VPEKNSFFAHSGRNKLGYAAVITLLVFVEADGLCNQYFAWQKLIGPFK
jgi:hypothetical protein